MVSNSTFSGNIAAAGVGGGLFVRRPATMQVGNSTFTANHAANGGGGIWLAATAANLASTIVQGNTVGAGQVADVDDPFVVGIAGNDNLVGQAGANVNLPADTLDADPSLLPLAANGGPTRTHALRAGSPAIDAGNNDANLAFDQRGAAFARVYGGGADIGAFERQGSLPPAALLPVPALKNALLALLAALLGCAAISYRPANAARSRRSRR